MNKTLVYGGIGLGVATVAGVGIWYWLKKKKGCGAHSTKDEVTGECACDAGFTDVLGDGVCVADGGDGGGDCTLPLVWDEATQKCVTPANPEDCVSPLVWNEDEQECQLVCAATHKSYYDSGKKKCAECSDNAGRGYYNKQTGSCASCPGGYLYDVPTGVCIAQVIDTEPPDPKVPAGPTGIGDIDQDGWISEWDVDILTNALFYGEPIVNGGQRHRADINGDGRVDGNDLTLLKRLVLGIDKPK